MSVIEPRGRSPQDVRTRPRRRGVQAALLAVCTALVSSLLVTTPAQAVVTSTTGAAVHTTGFCQTDTVNVFSSTTAFEWRRTWIYNKGQWQSTPWRTLSILVRTMDVYFVSGWTAVYVEYADALPGGGYEITGEFATLSGNSGPYWCLAF